jgi:uncharacterized protein YndB with AHSA1/START domain
METNSAKKAVTIEAVIQAPVNKVWEFWSEPRHIIQWNSASDDWHTPRATNDLRVGGRFLSHMEAKDGSIGFDFTGSYDAVELHKQIDTTLDDDRKVQVSFVACGNETKVVQSFETESENSVELQRTGWQAILNNFKKYAEQKIKHDTMHFEIIIHTSPAIVYQKMLAEKTYEIWTAAFNPTSHYKGSWDKDAKILFIGTDSNGKEGGMVSKIKENVQGQFVSIEHLGLIQDGIELMSGPEVESWAGAYENYSFTEVDGKTLLTIDIDVNDEFRSYFETTWPKALNILKTICEK